MMRGDERAFRAQFTPSWGRISGSSKVYYTAPHETHLDGDGDRPGRGVSGRACRERALDCGRSRASRTAAAGGAGQATRSGRWSAGSISRSTRRRQGPDRIRRSPAGHRTQPQGRRLDRSAAQELRLSHRARASTSTTRRRRPAAPDAAAVARAAGRSRPTRSSPAVKCDPDRAARAIAGSRGEPASTTIPMPSPTKSCASSIASRPRPARASRSTAPRSAPRAPTRCTSSARTWTDTAGARPPTTTDRARRW